MGEVDALDQVIVAVGDVDGVIAGGEEVGGGAADGFAVIGGGVDEHAGFPAGGDAGGGGVGDIDAPDGEGFGDGVVAQAGDFAAFEFDAVFGLFAGVAEGGAGEAALVEFVVFGGWDGAVFKQSDVGDEDVIAGDGEGVGVAADGDGADGAALGSIDDGEAEIGDVGTVEMAAVLGELHVDGVGVVELVDVEGDFGLELGGAGVEDEDAAAFAAGPVEEGAVGREVGTAGVEMDAAVVGGFWGRDFGDFWGGGLPVGDELADAVGGDEEEGAIAGHGHAVGETGEGEVLSGGAEEAAVGENCGAVGVVDGVGVAGGGVEVGAGLLGEGGEGC